MRHIAARSTLTHGRSPCYNDLSMDHFDTPFTLRRLLRPGLIDRFLSLFCRRVSFSLKASLPTYGETGYCICTFYILRGAPHIYSVDVLSVPAEGTFTLPEDFSDEVH